MSYECPSARIFDRGLRRFWAFLPRAPLCSDGWVSWGPRMFHLFLTILEQFSFWGTIL
jgi:hypothetical protein